MMKAEYMKFITIGLVAIVTLYLVANYGGELAARLGLNPVA